MLATTAGDVLQALGMRHHGEIHDFRPGALGRVASALAQSWLHHGIDWGDGGFLLRLHGADLDCRPELCGAGHRRQLHPRDYPGQVPAERAHRLEALDGRVAGGLRRGAPRAASDLAGSARDSGGALPPDGADCGPAVQEHMAEAGIRFPAGLHSQAGARARPGVLRGHPFARAAGLSRVRNPVRIERPG